ncbi:MAG: hypothetical protein AAGE01_17840 [Pseudomonadota bacterium]
MTLDPAFAKAFWANARWFPQQIDLVYGRLLLLELGEANYRQSMFLDQRLAAREPAQQVVPLWELAATTPVGTNPRALICHVGHCGSTLVSRILQEATPALCLREPLPLQALAQVERERGDALAAVADARYEEFERFLFSALGRSFGAEQPTIIKATSNCSNLLGRFLDPAPEHRALFVSLRLEPFLATMLRSELRRQETAGFCQSRLLDLHRLLDDDSARLHDLGPGELAAMSWAGNVLWLADAEKRHADRIRAVDFETLLDAPGAELATAARFLGLSADEARLAEVFGTTTRAYSKDPNMPYSRASRDRELEDCRQRCAEEIRQGLAWAENLVSKVPAAAPLAGLF